MYWNDYYIGQSGEYVLYQIEYVLGVMLGRFFKWIKPLIKKGVGPLLKGTVSDLGTEAVATATNIAKDSWAGKPISESLKKNSDVADI